MFSLKLSPDLVLRAELGSDRTNSWELRTIRTLANSDLGQFGPDSDLSCG